MPELFGTAKVSDRNHPGSVTNHLSPVGAQHLPLTQGGHSSEFGPTTNIKFFHRGGPVTFYYRKRELQVSGNFRIGASIGQAFDDGQFVAA